MATETAGTSKGMLWSGRILSGLIVAFMLFNASFGFMKPDMVRQGFEHTGYPYSLYVVLTVVMVALHADLRDSADGDFRRNSAYRILWRGNRHSREDRRAFLFSGCGLRTGVDWSLFAGRAATGIGAFSKVGRRRRGSRPLTR